MPRRRGRPAGHQPNQLDPSLPIVVAKEPVKPGSDLPTIHAVKVGGRWKGPRPPRGEDHSLPVIDTTKHTDARTLDDFNEMLARQQERKP